MLDSEINKEINKLVKEINKLSQEYSLILEPNVYEYRDLQSKKFTKIEIKIYKEL